MTIERTTVHVSDDASRIAMLEKRTIGMDDAAETLVRYVYSNHLQSASLELDGIGDIISYEEYHPYGTTAFQAKNATINAVAKRYRYTGKERDEESGLYYHGARYYIPWLCRWTAIDPMENKYAGMSPYNYGNCNPITFNDPSGMEGETTGGWGLKSNTWEYSSLLTDENYEYLNYDRFMSSGDWGSVNTDGKFDGEYKYSLNADGTVWDSKNGQKITSSFTTSRGYTIKIGDVGIFPPPNGEKASDNNAWEKYTVSEAGSNTTKVLAPNGRYFEFNKSNLDFTYSDGNESERQIKKEGVWSVKNANGQFLWDNINETYVLNRSGVGPGQNGPPLMPKTTTFAGGANALGYSQPPQNIADAGGRYHDIDYDNNGIAGFFGIMSPKSFNANLDLAAFSDRVTEMYANGEIDPYTGAKVSNLTVWQARIMKYGFNGAEFIKAPVTVPQKVKNEMQQGYNGFYNTLLNNWLRSIHR